MQADVTLLIVEMASSSPKESLIHKIKHESLWFFVWPSTCYILVVKDNLEPPNSGITVGGTTPRGAKHLTSDYAR